jgi:hypothetical protein
LFPKMPHRRQERFFAHPSRSENPQKAVFGEPPWSLS